MGRAVNQAHIVTRNARSKLPISKTVRWRVIDRGAHLGYRKGIDGGTWVARFRRPDGTYTTKAIGKADDALPADGGVVLDFYQATTEAKKWFAEQAHPRASANARDYTVKGACRDYVDWYRDHRKNLKRLENIINSDILPDLGDAKVAELAPSVIGAWHRNRARSAAKIRTPKGTPQRFRDDTGDADAPRRRKLTANRTLGVLKAALNYGYREGRITSDDGWRRVRPFDNVVKARTRYLGHDEATRLLNACRPDFRELVRGALLTGMRYGEITRLRNQDFLGGSGTVLVQDSKTGHPRHVRLTDEGREFFEQITAGRPDTAPMFPKRNGKSWGTAEQHRPLARACKAASLEGVIFHTMRHTYASWAVMGGIPLPVVAVQLGHANTRMVEKHYGHLADDFVALEIREKMPAIGLAKDAVVVPMQRKRKV